MNILYERSLLEKEFEKDSCGIGMAVNIKGTKSHKILKNALSMLERLEHRGAVGYDETTGDGAGVSFQIPHTFFLTQIEKLPKDGEYGVAQIFIMGDVESVKCEIETYITDEVLGWREVPLNRKFVGMEAMKTIPSIWQLFIRRSITCENFESYLYFLRTKIESRDPGSKRYYFCSFSCQNIVYKGLLLASQVGSFYEDLKSSLCETAFAIVHQRFSTNTYPSWKLAHPFRVLAHNGEINTIKGNIYNFLGRKIEIKGENKRFSGIDFNKSDSANLDSMIEYLIHSGKTLLEAVSIVVPSAWEANPAISSLIKNFYHSHSTQMEPWDGPAALILNYGSEIVAKLDRNGLRPSRFLITREGEMYLASESGTIDISDEEIIRQGRVKPGEALYIRLDEGKLYTSDEVDDFLANKSVNFIEDKIEKSKMKLTPKTHMTPTFFYKLCRLFSISREDLEVQIAAIAKTGQEILGSMGNDVALSIFSKNPHPLYMYFKQLFAQVTNPPIDPLREACIMSDRTVIGCNGGESHVKVKLTGPVISPEELRLIENTYPKLKCKRISTLFDSSKEGELERKIGRVKSEAITAINTGSRVVILSDRACIEKNANRIGIPMEVMVSSLHHTLIETGQRAGVDIIIESGEIKEVMQCALLIGFGALAIIPYFALEAIKFMSQNELYLEGNSVSLQENFLKGLNKGLLKIISKMGISTIQSYRSSQLFESVGLSKSVIDAHFKGVISRIGGLEMNDIEARYHALLVFANEKEEYNLGDIPSLGEFKYRANGEKRLFSPSAVANLQYSTRNGDFTAYLKFAKEINEQAENPITLRGCFEFVKNLPISIDEVESIESIMKRFCTGAMSYGSISKEAHEALAIAMNTIGGKSNSGEGGENFERYFDHRRSAIKQIASGRFGVTTDYLVSASELQIKMAQGAKPGEGGHLPGEKVSEEIGKTRHTTPGIDLISPPPHHDIYSIEDLAQLIYDLKNVNEEARISVKLVSEAGIGTVAVGVAKAHAEMILISGYDGGTGAAMLSSIRHAGLPWELGLSETHQALKSNHLRTRVRLQVDGQIKTGRDVVIGALLGAEEFGFSTAPLVVLGCVLMRACHTNMCPVGIATQHEELRKRFIGRSEYVINYFRFVAMEVREIMANLGIRKFDELVGRSDLLKKREHQANSILEKLDFSKIFYSCSGENIQKVSQEHNILEILDRQLIQKIVPNFDQNKIELNFLVKNSDRSVGAMLSGKLAKQLRGKMLESDHIKVNFSGVTGQSFGAFLIHGLTFHLKGIANDYVGKGLFGGKIILQKPPKASYKAEENIIAGNTLLFGAIYGELYANGVVGERFAVRNSGAISVCEGVGDHACEYMTGGRVVILGSTGINFAAGMSGGIAYVWDEMGDFSSKINTDMVMIDVISESDRETIIKMVTQHYENTQSEKAHKFLENSEECIKKIVKIISPKYKKLIEEGRT